jgi:hypothetical protein
VSLTALVAALLGILPNALLTQFFHSGGDTHHAYTLHVGLAQMLLAAPFLLAFLAAFVENQPFRVAALTAGFVESLVPTYFLTLFFVGIFFIPGVIAVFVADWKCSRVLAEKGSDKASALGGVLGGILLTVAWEPLLTSYDSNDHSVHMDKVETAGLIVLTALAVVSVTALIVTWRGGSCAR